MKLILRKFLDICLLKAGPQDLPSSQFLLGLSLFAYVTIGVFLTMINVSWGQAIFLVAVDLGLLGGLVYILLWANNLTERLVQVWTALVGTGAIFELIALPLLAWQQKLMVNAQADPASLDETGVIVSSLVLWIALFWNLIVIGHVLRHALSTLLPIGVALAVAYMYISITLTQNLSKLFS